MRVLVDVSYARRGHSGTGVYLRSVLPELAALGVEVVETGRVDRGRGGGGARSYANAAAEALWTQVELPARARRARADVIHHPLPALARRCAVPQVVTVHDLAFEVLPEAFDPRFRAYASRLHRHAARGAAAVVVPSERTAAEARALWGIPTERLFVAPHGPGQAPPPARRAARHFLFVGDAEPRKNLGRLLAAYERYRALAQDDPPVLAGEQGGPLGLVLAGRAAAAQGLPGLAGARSAAPPSAPPPGAAPSADAPGIRREPEPDLPALLASAAALVLPSLHEGFGLPALEAMHAGTPVIASRAGALPEVCGPDGARYVDPYDVDGIAAALHEIAATPPLRERLRRAGEQRAKRFGWRRSAEAHARAYAAALR